MSYSNLESVGTDFDDIMDSLGRSIEKRYMMNFAFNKLRGFLSASLTETNGPVTSLHDIYQNTLDEFPEVVKLYKWQCESNVLNSIKSASVLIKGVFNDTAPWLSSEVNKHFDILFESIIEKVKKKNGGTRKQKGGFTTFGKRTTRRLPAFGIFAGTSGFKFHNPNNNARNNSKHLVNYESQLGIRRNLLMPYNEEHHYSENLASPEKVEEYIRVLGKKYVFSRLKELMVKYAQMLNTVLEGTIRTNLKIIIDKYNFKGVLKTPTTLIVSTYYMSYCDKIIRKLLVNIISSTCTSLKNRVAWTEPLCDIIEKGLALTIMNPTNTSNINSSVNRIRKRNELS